MDLEIQTKWCALWYSLFRISLSNKRFEEAEDFYKIFQFWKRRMRIDEMLSKICETAEKENSK